MKLKACWIRKILKNYENIDFLWFNFIDYSKRKIDMFQAKEISEDIDEEIIKLSHPLAPSLKTKGRGIWKGKIKKVWLFDKKFSYEEIVKIMQFAKLDSVQLYSNNLENFKKLKNKWYFVIKPIQINKIEEFEKYKNFVDLFIIDGKNPWSWKTYDYKKINNLNLEKNFLLAGWVSEKNILEIKKIFKNNKFFCWVDVASSIDNWENIDLEKVNKIVNLIK